MRRNMVKWIPFDAVINSGKVVNNLANNKENIEVPILSDEQIYEIENKIINAYNLNTIIKIKYFKNNKDFIISSSIKKIDTIKKGITLSNNSFIYFSQIIDLFE